MIHVGARSEKSQASSSVSSLDSRFIPESGPDAYVVPEFGYFLNLSGKSNSSSIKTSVETFASRASRLAGRGAASHVTRHAPKLRLQVEFKHTLNRVVAHYAAFVARYRSFVKLYEGRVLK